MSSEKDDRKQSLASRWWGWSYRFSAKQVLVGFPVGVLFASRDERDTISQKVTAALEIIRQNDPRRFGRLQRDAIAILVVPDPGAQGQWVAGAQLIVLQFEYVLRATTTTVDVAATIVHEGTHAWLDRLGFRYTEDRRARIEAICFRCSAAFARKLPDPGEVLERTERYLTIDSQFWTNEGFRKRSVDSLLTLGVPKWLVRFLARAAKRRIA